ncbi:MAG: hypothetical protein J6J33_06065 [Clostridia bacterium]|nr:hypothetical protein [Clostridia bacterium]
MIIDSHLHTLLSDGKDDVQTLIKNVGKTSANAFSITDHDTAESGRQILSSSELQELISSLGLTYTTGVEFTCTYKGHKMHILAYDFDPFAPEILELEQEFKELLSQKAMQKIAKLDEMGYPLSEASLQELSTKINVRTLDLATCLINEGYFNDINVAARFVVKEVKVPIVARLNADYVISKLSKIGAKMVWAHSLYGVGDKPRTHDEVRELATELKSFGLQGLECYYSLYDEEEIKGLVKIANDLGLFMTSGSDYHGANKSVKITEFSRDGYKVVESDVDAKNFFQKHIVGTGFNAKGGVYEC